MGKKTYPEGTRFNRWVIINDNDGGTIIPRIRRWAHYPNGKKTYERYPSNKYAHLRDNPKELENFVIRLNGEDPDEKRVKLLIKFRHAYIDPQLLDLYLEYLLTQIPSKKHALIEFTNLQRYFFGFFIVKMGIADPVMWHRQQNHWAKALLNKVESDDSHFKEEWRLFPPDEIRSAKTLRSIVSGANRFMQFLHERRPDEVPPLKFVPLNRAAYKELEARRKLKGKVTIRKFIPIEHWQTIKKRLPKEIVAWVHLSYLYGLRRSEAMAIDHSSIMNQYLKVTKQLTGFPESEKPVYGPLKGRKERKVPHWFCTPAEAYEWVNQVGKPMHPDTFSKQWAGLMKELDFDYDIHDLRHTWVTRSIRLEGVVPREVQLAAGHESIETTMGYLHDDRAFGDELFVPDKNVLSLKKAG